MGLSRDALEDLLKDAGAMMLEPRRVFDKALVGLAERMELQVAAYDSEKVVRILMAHHKMDRDEAEEFFEFNMKGSYVGDGTPVFLDVVRG